MAEVLMFHHALGQTAGFLAFADELRAAGHTVQAPDLYDGRTFGTPDEGMGFVKEIGFGEILSLPDNGTTVRFWTPTASTFHADRGTEVVSADPPALAS